ncbi:uncharacterized protein At3g43530 [Capsella rubella]|uniref:uncharacterized protein At3g43530 n=1 Tax=Capsella rubella TaxID=81985 RepID=UPI000CD5B3A8|nr:uncharacterized protein At3g43530 [Capsella rubella]
MYFSLSEYMLPFKLYAKCYITRIVSFLRAHLKSHELDCIEFVGKDFGVATTIRYDDVKAKLLSMKKASPDRVKMVVLYFLCSVLIGKGVLSTQQWVFPSFVIPLEVLAFEAIPVLKENFRECVSNAHAHCHCPRMCKMKFKASKMKGFSMNEIFDKLGTTKDIESIFTPSSREKRLLGRKMDEESRYNDVDDPVVDGWTKCLIDEEKSIWFEEIYNQDLATRETNQDPEYVISGDVNLENLGARLIQLEEQVKQGFKEIIENVDGLDNRVKSVESNVKWASGEDQYYTNAGVGDMNGGGNGDTNEGDKEQAEMEQAEKDKFEKEQAKKEQAERAKTEKAERAKANKAERAKWAKTEKAERAERAKIEKAERARTEKVERAKAKKAKAEKDKAERARAEKDKADKEQADKAKRAKAEKDKAEKEQADKAERADKEHAEKEQTEKEKAEKSETEKEKVDEEKAQLGTTDEET